LTVMVPNKHKRTTLTICSPWGRVEAAVSKETRSLRVVLQR
jgi:hypothetical protein